MVKFSKEEDGNPKTFDEEIKSKLLDKILEPDIVLSNELTEEEIRFLEEASSE